MAVPKFSGDFSGFSNLNDLSNYSCNELMEIIKDMQVKVWFEDVYKYVLWENEQVAITICFNLSDQFLYIKREVWKDMGVDISHTHED